LLTQTSFVLVVLLVVTALFEIFAVLFLLVVDLEDVECYLLRIDH
jgi:hypothetical protein